MQKIDAHSHVGYFGGWADVGYTDEQMVAEMDRYGIEKSVVSYMDNTVVEQAVKRFPDRFVGITWANPYEGDKAVETVVREVREHGFQGIKLHPLLNAFTANDGASSDGSGATDGFARIHPFGASTFFPSPQHYSACGRFSKSTDRDGPHGTWKRHLYSGRH